MNGSSDSPKVGTVFWSNLDGNERQWVVIAINDMELVVAPLDSDVGQNCITARRLDPDLMRKLAEKNVPLLDEDLSSEA